jgi:DNA-binding winged helix-turn-helix (wHTH) protein/TolB-like protein/Tfp pilus assembly protein PilF
MPLEESRFYGFGPYRIDTLERRLLRGSEPVPLTPKAFDTLLALVENAGHGLEKDELMRRVWPDTFVEESSLARNISVLRKVLGDEDGRYIETLPKRGYRFAAPVEELRLPAESVVVEHATTTRVVIEETESTNWRLPSVRVVTVALLAIVASALAYVTTRRSPSPAIQSLAVLPLNDLTGGDDRKHLELGIADSVIGRVSEISGLTVRPTGAVRKYVESGTDPLRAGRELKVDAVLDGTLQMAGNRIRVSLNLIETSKGVSLWAQAFDVPLSNIFEVEDEVARQVATQLRFRLDSAAQSRVARHSTRNAEAYEHYLKGLYSSESPRMTRAGRAAIEAAIVRFRKAIDLDPSYAQAWAQLAICYNELITYHRPDPNLVEEASNAAGRAYALDPDLPDLLVFRAQTFWSWNGHYQIEEAIRELRRATGYNSAEVRSLLGVIYSHVGLDRQAITELKRAIEIDPANSLYLDRLAQGYVLAGRYDDARAAYQRAFALESEGQGTLTNSAVPFLYAHQFDEARRRLENARRLEAQDRVTSAYLALLAALEGRYQEAEGAIPSDTHEMEKFRDTHHAFYAFASIFALQGKSAEAVPWLRKTVETGMPDYPLFARDPNLARVRASAEFVQFMAELKPRYEAMEREFR